MGGDIIEIKDGKLYRNNSLVEEPYLTEKMIGDFGPYRVPRRAYFMMGRQPQQFKGQQILGE